MDATPISTALPFDPWASCFDHAPLPMAVVEEEMHVLCFANPAFCLLVDKSKAELLGRPFRDILPERPEWLALLERVYRTGKSESHIEPGHAQPNSIFASYSVWPMMAEERIVGVVIQMIEMPPLLEKTRAISEALMLGAVRQHELAEEADLANIQLQVEIALRKQRERDAQMLTHEIAHRIKNNLQIIVGMIDDEANSAPGPSVAGYAAMQSRIGAIGELYDLMSQSSHGETVALHRYLTEIAAVMSASLLGGDSRIRIEVKAEAVEIDPNRAVAFGLLVNELVTNAIKHAFPAGAGTITLGVKPVGDEIELTVADNGVGIKDVEQAKPFQEHGTAYISIFVRQLGGSLAVSSWQGTGTTFRVRLPLRALRPESEDHVVL